MSFKQESRHITTFYTHNGLYYFRIQVGKFLLINQVLSVFGQSVALTKSNLTVNVPKCLFSTTKIKLFRRRILQRQISSGSRKSPPVSPTFSHQTMLAKLGLYLGAELHIGKFLPLAENTNILRNLALKNSTWASHKNTVKHFNF